MTDFEIELKRILDEGIKAYLAESDEEWDRIKEGLANDFAKAYVEAILGLVHKKINGEKD